MIETEMTASKTSIERLRQDRVELELRRLEKGAALPSAIAVADVTHEWDGWLFGGLVFAALWPVLQTLGWF